VRRRGSGVTALTPSTPSTRTQWLRSGGSTLYVAAVALCAGIATADSDHLVIWAWAAALILVIPSIILVIPAIYVLVPLSWHLSDHRYLGRATMVAYIICFGAGAVTNLAGARLIVRRRRRRRSDPRPPG
jgi:hypothetical protein